MTSHVLLKTLFYSFVFVLLFTTCKKDNNSGGVSAPSITYGQVATMLTDMEHASLKVEQYFTNQPDTIGVLFDVSQWLLDRPGVDEVYMIDDYMLEVHFTSGIVSDLILHFEDPSGKAIIRGGGTQSPNTLVEFSNPSFKSAADDKIIENKKVLVFSPYNQSFYDGTYPYLSKIEDAPLDLEVDLITDNDADLDVLKTFKDYGLIIINTHGKVDGFEVRTDAPLFSPNRNIDTTKVVEANLVQQQMLAAGISLSQIENGEVKLTAGLYLEYDSDNKPIGYRYNYNILVTDKHIRKLPGLDDAVVFGNYCYSGYTQDGPNTSNVPEAFQSIGAVTYFGYARDDGSSDAINTDIAAQVEESVLQRLLYDGDSTGNAYLKPDGSEWEDPWTRKRSKGGQKTKVEKGVVKASFVSSQKRRSGQTARLKQFGSPRYKYESCGSIVDNRDQQEYQLACIGDQVWMAENLNWAGAGKCHEEIAANCQSEGRLYTLDEVLNGQTSTNDTPVKGICPQGFHVPSKAELEEMITFLGGADSATAKLGVKNQWPNDNGFFTNESGFSLRPAKSGYYRSTQGSINWGDDDPFFFHEQASFYTSTVEYNRPDPDLISANFFWHFKMRQVSGLGNYGIEVYEIGNNADLYSYMHCRCVQD